MKIKLASRSKLSGRSLIGFQEGTGVGQALVGRAIQESVRECGLPDRDRRRVADAAELCCEGQREPPTSQHPSRHHDQFRECERIFGLELVSLIDEVRIEGYKTWRANENKVRDVTLRHDLHALSKFFRYAIKQRWTRENPIRSVEIPSDEDAVRMHVLTTSEEQQYLKRAAKHRDLHDLGRLMLNRGPRPDEVVSLLNTDVDLKHRKMYIRKGKSRAARRKLDLTVESCRIARRANGR